MIHSRGRLIFAFSYFCFHLAMDILFSSGCNTKEEHSIGRTFQLIGIARTSALSIVMVHVPLTHIRASLSYAASFLLVGSGQDKSSFARYPPFPVRKRFCWLGIFIDYLDGSFYIGVWENNDNYRICFPFHISTHCLLAPPQALLTRRLHGCRVKS